jgi:hypothetical protein
VKAEKLTACPHEHAPFVGARIMASRTIRMEEVVYGVVEEAHETQVLLMKQVFSDVGGRKISAKENISQRVKAMVCKNWHV